MEFHRAASQPPVTGQAMRTGFRFRVNAGVSAARDEDSRNSRSGRQAAKGLAWKAAPANRVVDTALAMSEENVNVVRAFLDASMRRDEARVAELADPGIELHGTVGGVEEGRIYRGLAEVIREYDEVDGEAWEERRLEPEGFLDADDAVVVMFHEFRRGQGSGVELELDTAAVFTLRDGRVARMQGFMDPAAARKAAGLSE